LASSTAHCSPIHSALRHCGEGFFQSKFYPQPPLGIWQLGREKKRSVFTLRPKISYFYWICNGNEPTMNRSLMTYHTIKQLAINLAVVNPFSSQILYLKLKCFLENCLNTCFLIKILYTLVLFILNLFQPEMIKVLHKKLFPDDLRRRNI
jgi:hypothetical protein